ncbi:MAG TPA: 4,5-DOPA dioxygenase extradiol [Dongiaceae bacterium]|nr:4,5-DOPA dioxygenase extradiol [Dongiaceae bacterium]
MKMPVLFVGHGSPMNAIQENAFTRCLGELGERLPEPKAVCVISAHWVTRGCHVLGMGRPRTIHDFYGFPKPLYQVNYPAPGAVAEAKRLAMEQHLNVDHEWGLDHGAWSVLRHMYPQANVPVFQVSLDHEKTFAEHVALGKELQKLRERGVLILGSGNVVHNLHKINWEMPNAGYGWAEEFDAKVKRAMEERDLEGLAAPEHWGGALLGEAHPTLEHYAPVLYCMGAAAETDEVSFPYEGMEFGTISMRMAMLESRAA